jgi:dienelactone hydrolase
VLREHQLWLVRSDGRVEQRLTDDGEPDHAYAGSTGNNCAPVTLRLMGVELPPLALWAPDSSRFLTHRIDERHVPPLHMLRSVPGEGKRPEVHTYRCAMTGEAQPLLTHWVFDVNGGGVALQNAPIPLPFVSLLEQGHAWWSADGQRGYFIETGPYANSLTLMEFDPSNGAVREVLKERSDTFLEAGTLGLAPSVRVTGGGDVIWYSRQDGHAHLYRHDLATGALKNRITEGPWMVRDIVHIDERSQTLWFTGSGREPGRQPVFRRLYRVQFDGTGLTLLTPEDADHEVPLTAMRIGRPMQPDVLRSGVSPGGHHIVYTRSAPDLSPVSFVASADGQDTRELLRGELLGTTLNEAMVPESFEALAADGVTPLYGTLFRPRDFDPGQRYALIDAIYPGPQHRRVATTFAGSVLDPYGALAMAQRGFVVFTIDGRGTPDRSQAFLRHSYGRLSDAGSLDDHVAVIRQLSQRLPCIDAERVGIYGFSGGGYASVRAMLMHPQVFKAGAAGCGNHQQHRYIAIWGETYDGPSPQVQPDNVAIADRLQGALMLVHGEMDDNVHPSHLMTLVDALVRADKDFEMLLVPGVGHDFGHAVPHVFRRMGDFLLRQLGGPVR